MPSLFPDLFTYRELAPLLFRVVLGIIFLGSGSRKLFSDFSHTEGGSEKAKPQTPWMSFLGAVEFLGGLLLMAGFLTQLISALLILSVAAKGVFTRGAGLKGFTEKYERELLAVAILFALLVLGPGAYSIDLPF